MFSTILNISSKHNSLIDNIALIRVEEHSRVFPSTREGFSFDDVVEFMDSGLSGLD